MNNTARYTATEFLSQYTLAATQLSADANRKFIILRFALNIQGGAEKMGPPSHCKYSEIP